jgi:putative transcriptional regulator
MPDGEVRNEIRRLRFERGELTQAQLAEEVGCSRQTIVLLEQCRYTPSLALAFRVARAFGRTVDEVFELVE